MSKDAKIKRLFQISGVDADLDLQYEGIKKILSQLCPPISEEELNKVLDKQFDIFRDKLAVHYGNTFSEPQIDQITQFWAKGPGSKIASQKFREEVVALSQEWASDVNKECLYLLEGEDKE